MCIRLHGYRKIASLSVLFLALKHLQLNPVLEPGSYLPVEQFPILKLIPARFVPSVSRAKDAYKKQLAIWDDAHQRVLDRRQCGDERYSMADSLLSGNLKVDVPFTSRSQINGFFAALDQGAAETTQSMLLTHILLLAKHPWVQRKAQLELDQLCGEERAPTWQDFKDLPYINCIIKEGLRMRPV